MVIFSAGLTGSHYYTWSDLVVVICLFVLIWPLGIKLRSLSTLTSSPVFPAPLFLVFSKETEAFSTTLFFSDVSSELLSKVTLWKSRLFYNSPGELCCQTEQFQSQVYISRFYYSTPALLPGSSFLRSAVKAKHVNSSCL